LPSHTDTARGPGVGAAETEAAVNVDWHRDHVLGQGAPLDERVTWHLEHARACACRPIPARIATEIQARGLDTSTEGRDGAEA
jgi:hypothetical protein